LATTYYVDPNGGIGWLSTQAGTALDPFLGCAGFQKALNTVAAGDKILVKTGTFALTQFVKLQMGHDKTATWIAGDTMQNDTGDGNDWTGKLLSITTAYVYVELQTGSYTTVATADGIENTTHADTDTLSYKEQWYFESKTHGTAAAPIRMIGTDASWTEGAGFVTIDGNSESVYCLEGSRNYNIFQNFIAYRGGYNGFSASFTTTTFIKCVAKNSVYYGFYMGGSFSLCLFCHAYSCPIGFCSASQVSLIGCIARNNTYVGIEIDFHNTLIDRCIVYENDDANIFLSYSYSGLKICGCVIHGALSGPGILLSGTGACMIFLGNRITGNATYGIESDDANNAIYENYNYFQGNTSGNLSNVNSNVIGANSISGTDTDYGYNDSVNAKFDLVATASLRRTAIDLNWVES